MHTYKEQYRKFDLARLVGFLETPAPTAQPEAPKDKPKAEPNKEEAAKDLSADIKDSQRKANDWIKHLQNVMYKTAPQANKDAATLLAQKLQQHADREFGRISTDYLKARVPGGAAFETTDAARDMEKRANALAYNISERVKGSKTYVEFQTYIETMTPEKRQATVSKYLREYNEETRDMPDQVRENLARLIVEAGLVNFQAADLRGYTGNIDDYFKSVEQFYTGNIAGSLGVEGDQEESIVKKVVDSYLKEAPNPAATKEEIDMFKVWIAQDTGNPSLSSLYGTSQEADKPAHKVATIMAEQLDVRFKDGKISYGIDLRANPPKVLGAEEFKAAFLQTLRTNNLYDAAVLKRHADEVHKQTDRYKEMREEIADIDEWEDWADHQEAADMMKASAAVREQAKKYDKPAGAEAPKQDEATAKRAKEGYDAYMKAAREAGVDSAMDKATKEGGYTYGAKKVPDFINTTEGFQELTNDKEKTKIRIDLNTEGKIKVTVSGTAEPTFSVNSSFDAAGFKAKFDSLGLADYAKQLKANLEQNSAKIKGVQNEMTEYNADVAKRKSGATLDFSPSGNSSDLAGKAYPIPTANIVKDGMVLGTVTFDASDYDKGTTKNTNEIKATITIAGKKSACQLDALNLQLNTRDPEIKKQADAADKIKKEIEGQIATDIQAIKPPEGLNSNPVKPAGDFLNPEARVPITSLSNTNGTLVATLNMVVGPAAKPGAKPTPRLYELKVVGEQNPVACKDIAAVNAYLVAHPDLAALPPAKPKDVPIKPENAKARENLVGLAMTLMSEKMKSLDAKSPEFNNALNTFINGLPADRVKQLEKPPVTLTKEEQVKLQIAFRDAYYGTLDTVNDNEVQLVNSLNVKVEGKPDRTFEAAFGPNLARTLSMSHIIEEGSDKDKVRVDGRDVTVRGLANYVPESMRPNYIKILEGKSSADDEKALQDKAGEEVKARETMREISALLSSPEGAKSFKNMNFAEFIVAVAELIKIFRTALETGDYETLRNGIEDLHAGVNPMEGIKSARKEYTEKVNNIADTGTLLSLYTEPYGTKAKELFKDGPNAIRYRVELKRIIEERFESDLQVDISKMEVTSANALKISANKLGKNYTIYLENASGQTYASMDATKTEPATGKEVLDPTASVPKKVVKGMKAGTDNLAATLFGATAAGAGETGKTKPETTAEAPKVKTEYATKNTDGSITLKGVEKVSLDKVFDPGVTGGTIQLAKSTGDFKAGAPIDFTMSAGKTYVGGIAKKIPIHDGDKILKTTQAAAATPASAR